MYGICPRSPFPPCHWPVPVKLRSVVLVPLCETFNASFPWFDTVPNIFEAGIPKTNRAVWTDVEIVCWPYLHNEYYGYVHDSAHKTQPMYKISTKYTFDFPHDDHGRCGRGINVTNDIIIFYSRQTHNDPSAIFHLS